MMLSWQLCDSVMTNESEFVNIVKEFKDFQTKFEDPVFIATLLHKLSEERSSSNLVLKEVNAKLDRLLALEARIASIEQKLGPSLLQQQVVLSPTDKKIVALAKKKPVCAEDVREALKYKGKNAASARLNALVKKSVLHKKQVGKKVYFTIWIDGCKSSFHPTLIACWGVLNPPDLILLTQNRCLLPLYASAAQQFSVYG